MQTVRFVLFHFKSVTEPVFCSDHHKPRFKRSKCRRLPFILSQRFSIQVSHTSRCHLCVFMWLLLCAMWDMDSSSDIRLQIAILGILFLPLVYRFPIELSNTREQQSVTLKKTAPRFAFVDCPCCPASEASSALSSVGFTDPRSVNRRIAKHSWYV